VELREQIAGYIIRQNRLAVDVVKANRLIWAEYLRTSDVIIGMVQVAMAKRHSISKPINQKGRFKSVQ